MTDVSGTLRAARERAGLSIEDIWARTKIKPSFLQAIERGEFELLPGQFFARAFLRTYAREVHVSPDEIVAAFDARYPPADHETPSPQPERLVADRLSAFRLGLPVPLLRGVWPTLALGAAILIGLSIMNRSTSDGTTAPQPVGTAGVAEGASPSAAVPQPTSTVPEKLTVEIRPTRVMWVAGMADGKRVIYRLLEPTERVRIDAHQDLWFRVGDAGAFVYSINGSQARPLGAPGEVRELTITRDNYQTLSR